MLDELANFLSRYPYKISLKLRLITVEPADKYDLQSVLRSRDILAGAGMKGRLRLQLRTIS